MDAGKIIECQRKRDGLGEDPLYDFTFWFGIQEDRMYVCVVGREFVLRKSSFQVEV